MKFRTDDGRFGLIIESAIIVRLLQICREAGTVETGGILVGRYTPKHDNAIVTDVSGPPPDSKKQAGGFSRGIKGLQRWLNRLWFGKREYYLGEWHFHPFASAVASGTDMKQLRDFSQDSLLRCPEPVMLIIGGDPSSNWTLNAYVSPKNECVREMQPVNEGGASDARKLRETEWILLG